MQHTVFKSDTDTLITTQSLTVLPDCVIAKVLRENIDTGAAQHSLQILDLQGVVRGQVTVTDTPDDLEQRLVAGLLPNDTAIPVSDLMRGFGDGAIALSTLQGQASLHVSDGVAVLQRSGQDDVHLSGLDVDALSGTTKGVVLNNLLFLGRADPRGGFDVLSCDLTDPKAGPKIAISRGAGRFSLNAAVSAMAPIQGGVLIGTAALAGHDGQVGNWGPEILLLSADGDWDLIVGQPRFSPDGLKLPAAGQGPGFGAKENASLACLLSSEGRHVAVCQAYTGPMQVDRREVMPDLLAYQGRITVFTSDDLIDWRRQTVDLGDFPGAVTCAQLTDGALWLGFEVIGADEINVRRLSLT